MPAKAAENQYAVANRRKKADKLKAELIRHTAKVAAEMTDDQWTQLADRAGVRKPGAECRQMIIDQLNHEVEWLTKSTEQVAAELEPIWERCKG